MYATCLFCNSALGRNDCLEHFPVGRRLAYDAARGRLWVVCRRCQRWNLTPFESRWEAIEEAERGFRATRQRVATDNVALARLKEGLELVRIGAPPRLELATWRYGDQFGRRRRKYIGFTAAGMAATLAPQVASIAGHSLVAMSTVVEPAMIGLSAASIVVSFIRMREMRRHPRVPVVFVTDGQGKRQPLTRWDAQSAWLSRGPEGADWSLSVKQAEQPLPRYGIGFAHLKLITLQGDEARRALAAIVPHANSAGGSAKRVREAVDMMSTTESAEQVVRAAVASGPRETALTKNYLAAVPAPIRLAIEMALHEDDERRAMEGELAALEERWRDAEEIAGIADGLLFPADAASRLEELRRAREAADR